MGEVKTEIEDDVNGLAVSFSDAESAYDSAVDDWKAAAKAVEDAEWTY